MRSRLDADEVYASGDVVIGFAPVGLVKIPATNSKKDIGAAKKAMFSMSDKNLFNNTWWMEPVFRGRYPEDGMKILKEYMPKISDADMKIISQPLDFFGVNVYMGEYIRAGKDGKPEVVPYTDGQPITQFRWPVTPEALYWGPKFFHEMYKLPIIVTENGMSNVDWVSLDGKVHDPQRIDFTHRYLLNLKKAIDEGVDVRGYFHWSYIDNFEWAEGFKQRFGLIYVDFPTQKRTLKDSARWYKNLIASDGASLDSF